MADGLGGLAKYNPQGAWRLLGRGEYASVYQCVHLETGSTVAVKAVAAVSEQVEQRFINEFEILRNNRQMNPNIVEIQDCFTDGNVGYIVMELCRGTVADRLTDGWFEEDEAVYVISSVLHALAFLHGRNIIHRDVKPANIMYAPGANGWERVVLGDFDVSKIVGNTVPSTRVGTKGYQAPEILKGHAYDELCDVWSLGIVAFQLLHGMLPFPNAETTDMAEGEMIEFMGQFPSVLDLSQVSGLAADFIQCCLNPLPEARPSAERLMTHAWLTNPGG